MAAVAKFVAAQQMRTPLFFIEFVKRMNEHIPEALAAVLRRLDEKGPAELHVLRISSPSHCS